MPQIRWIACDAAEFWGDYPWLVRDAAGDSQIVTQFIDSVEHDVFVSGDALDPRICMALGYQQIHGFETKLTSQSLSLSMDILNAPSHCNELAAFDICKWMTYNWIAMHVFPVHELKFHTWPNLIIEGHVGFDL